MSSSDNFTLSSETGKSGHIRQLVCFRLGNEDFGIDINRVHEINRMIEITPIPQAPSFVEGVINLRGEIIPVIDLTRRFNLAHSGQRDHDSRIVVIETNKTLIGFIVDAVTEVLRITDAIIQAAPGMVTGSIAQQYIEGVAMLENEHLLILLDTEKIFSEEENRSMSQMAPTA